MQVILTEDVVGLGDIGEQVSVKPGYARNFLIPRGLAVESGTANARKMAHHMTQIEAKKRRLKGAAESLAQKVRDLSLEFELRVGSSGKVFGSIGTREIAEKLSAAIGHPLDRRKILLSEPLKKIGTHFVKVRLHADVEAQLKLNVTQVEASKEQEEEAAQNLKTTLEEKAAETQDAAE